MPVSYGITVPVARGTNGLVVVVVVDATVVDGVSVLDGVVVPSMVLGTALDGGSSSPAAATAITTIIAASTAPATTTSRRRRVMSSRQPATMCDRDPRSPPPTPCRRRYR